MTAVQALAALLALYPHARAHACIERRRDRIVHAVDVASVRHGVPVQAILATGWYESWLGCHPASGGSWGAPADRLHRHRAGGVDEAASALALGMRRCGSLVGAVRNFRTGSCRPGRHEDYVRQVVGLARRLEGR